MLSCCCCCFYDGWVVRAGWLTGQLSNRLATAVVVVVGLVNGCCCVNYLVDPASSHMLVLKIKPCMPKFRWFDEPRLRMAQ